jgi:hypothetical protein
MGMRLSFMTRPADDVFGLVLLRLTEDENEYE